MPKEPKIWCNLLGFIICRCCKMVNFVPMLGFLVGQNFPIINKDYCYATFLSVFIAYKCGVCGIGTAFGVSIGVI